MAGRPQLVKGNRQLLFGGMGRLTENSVINIKNKSHAVTAEIEVPECKEAGEGRIDQTEPFVFSADETCDVGDEFGSPVTPDYPSRKKFSGEVNWVQIDLDKDAEDANHFISPEERLRVFMGIQ